MVDFTQSLYYAREQDGIAMIELTMNRQSPQPFEVVIRILDISTTGTYLHAYELT